MEKVFKYIDEHQDEYIELLKKFCSQPSVSAQNLGIQEMSQMIRDHLDMLGVQTERIETDGYPIIYGELGHDKPYTLTFYNHYDVQPPEPLELWETPPFEPTIRGDRIYARGVADNKGSFLSRWCAVDAYQKVYGKLPCNIKFITEGEEEVGSPNLDSFRIRFPEKLKTDGIVWEGGSKDINRGPLQVTLGYKGLCYVELRCHGVRSDMHSSYAPIVQSATWRLVWALNSIKDENDRITIDGFYDDVVPSTEEDMGYLEGLFFDEESMKKSNGIASYINGLTGVPLKEKYLYQPTANIAGIESGYTGEGSKTVIPNYAFCKIDFRLVQGQDADKVVELLRKHLDKHGFTDVEVVKISGKNPYRADTSSRIVKAALKNAEEIYGMKPSVYRNSPGTTAMGTFCGPTGIPAVSFGIDHAESQIHAPNENIYLEDFINGIKMTAAVMHDFGTSRDL
jgi:acetylornithine deacetylase/succinyl-diaminopimelate desuccinylase-like protein